MAESRKTFVNLQNISVWDSIPRETPKNVGFHEKTEALISRISDFILMVDMLYL